MRMAKIQDTDNQFWPGCETTGTVIHCWWECKMEWPLWKTVWQLLTKSNIFLPYDPASTLLFIPKNWKSMSHKNLCTDVYSSFIHTCLNLAATKILDTWMDKLNVIPPDNGILLSTKKKCAIQAMKSRGGTLNAHYWVKEVNQIRLHPV